LAVGVCALGASGVRGSSPGTATTEKAKGAAARWTAAPVLSGYWLPVRYGTVTTCAVEAVPPGAVMVRVTV
jgi:hypothetical protein